MSEWQPIETAPRDGSSVLAFVPFLPRTTLTPPFRILALRWDESMEWRTDVYAFIHFRPTHWMSLPAPPVSSVVKESLTGENPKAA